MAKDSGGIDYAQLLKIANSPAGQELISLVQKNKDAQFEQAMQQAQDGDFSQAKDVLQKMLSTPEAQELVRKIRGEK